MKNKIVLFIEIIISFVFALFAFSFAYFLANISGNENTSGVIINAATLKLNFIDSNYINEPNIFAPWIATKTFTVENIGTNPVSYSIMWDTLTNTLVGKENLTYTITSTGVGAGMLFQTQVPNSGTNINILQDISIEPHIIHTYTVTFNYALTSSDQTSDMEKLFNGKFKVIEYES